MIETGLPRRRRRPRAVSFVGWLLCTEALLMLAIGVLDMVSQGGSPRARLDLIGELIRSGTDLIQVRIPVLTVIGGAALLVAGVGLLRMRHWAWLLAMTIEAVSLAVALRWYALGDQHFGPMALSSFVVLALNQREVRQAFIHDHPDQHNPLLDYHDAG